jgi:hypothetical protein
MGIGIESNTRAAGRSFLASAEGIAEWKNIESHAGYALGLRKNHSRKAGFWSLAEAKPKRR